MDSLLNRYRSIVLLIAVLVGQFILLAYQVKTDNDIPLVRVWAVTAITPIAQFAESARSTVYGVFHNYFDLRDARSENRHMRGDIDKLKLENQYLRNELSTADRVKALAAFEKQSPSKFLAARIIGAATTSASKVVFLDRGSNADVEKGMAVITPDGIVGKILAAYPTASQALLATDPSFAAGVVSQKNHVRGILRGIGSGKCNVDNVQNEETVEPGEMFYTSGDDRVFPRGMPVGTAAVVRDGDQFKQILLYPAGLQNGPEEVLIVIQGEHQLIPQYKGPEQKVYIGTPPPTPKGAEQASPASPLSTDADRLREKYEKIGAAENHKFGEGNVPNFNVPLPAVAKSPTITPPGTPTQPVKPGAGAPVPLTEQRPARQTPAKPKPAEEGVSRQTPAAPPPQR